MRQLTHDEIEGGLAHVATAPRDHGTLEMIVLRPEVDRRTTPAQAMCSVDEGVVGDNWVSRGSRHTEDGSANPDQQITVMNARYLDLIADGDRSRWPLAGDQLVVDLDLSEDALQPGDRCSIGHVVLEVTPHPHRGCAKFRDRFGVDAVRVANGPIGRAMRLRGVHVSVVEGGVVRVGDRIARVDVPAGVAD